MTDRSAKPLVWDGLWEEVHAAIEEIEWFATRKKDLSALCDYSARTWAEVLLDDICYLRAVIDEARRP